MRDLFKAVSLAAAATLGTAAIPASALAADLPIIEAPEPLPIATAGGWYLRGDIGYKFYKAPKGSLSNPAWGYGPNGHSGYQDDGHDQMLNEKMLGAADFGIGVGYQFNDYLRSDLTLDYETPAKFTGTMWCQSGSVPPCDSRDDTGTYKNQSLKISAWSALANVYADLADLNGLKPYIGAGAGLSYLRTSSVSTEGFEGTDGSSMQGAGKWNFAWALMAGVSYPLSDQLSVDLGYRYLNLGDAKTSSVADTEYGRYEATRFDYKNVQAHEVRLGLRYLLN